MPGYFEAGKGGWPTVRYFNADTGYSGAPYQQKTSKSMCDELGDPTYMRAYVEDKGPKPCDALAADLTNCSDKQKTFVAAWKAKTLTQRIAELARLEKIGQTLVATADIVKWNKQRVAILKQLVTLHDEL